MAAPLPPDTDYTKRDEGNAADWLAQQWFNGADPDKICGTKAPNGWVITPDMVDFVGQYIKALECGEMQCVTTIGNERWQVNARADHINWRIDERGLGILTVDDLKYGYRIVEPFENWTLIAHAIGECIKQQAVPDVIVLRIHQPRAYHPDGKLREWRLSYAELMRYFQRIDAVLSNLNDQLQTGPYCFGCHAEPTCPARRMASYSAIDVSELAYNDELPVDVLNYEMDLLERAKDIIAARLDALTELAIHRIRQGEPNQERVIEQRKGQTRFKSGFTAEFLTAATGIDCTKPGIITPAEFLRRGGSQGSYDALTERPLTGTKLIKRSADAHARKLLNKG